MIPARAIACSSFLALLSSFFAGCYPPSLVDRYAGDLARYEETGTIADPPLEDELATALADSDDRVIRRRRDALSSWNAPQIEETAGSAPSDLDAWRLATLPHASAPMLHAMRERSSAQIERLRGRVEGLGPAIEEDDLLGGLEDEPGPPVGGALATRTENLRLRRALETEERKLALIEEELAVRGE